MQRCFGVKFTFFETLQNSIEFKDLGVGTSANTFFRSIGGTVGVAMFGSIYANRLAHYIPEAVKSVGAKNPAALAGATPEKFAQLKNNTAILKTLHPDLQSGILHAFVQSFHIVFLAAVPITAIGFFIALFLRETPLRTSADHHAAKEEAAGEMLG